MIPAIITTAFLLPVFLLIVTGKGDALIAGYNTASEEKRACYDVGRLRKVIATLLIIIVALSWVQFMVGYDRMEFFLFQLIFEVGAVVVAIILANTWAKKKS